MIRSISGQITNIDKREMLVDVSGVGYLVQYAGNADLKAGTHVKIFTVHHQRDDSPPVLFGFMPGEDDAYDMFKDLKKIMGITTAYRISFAVSRHDLDKMVSSGNIKPLLEITGVGKKLAETILSKWRSKK